MLRCPEGFTMTPPSRADEKEALPNGGEDPEPWETYVNLGDDEYPPDDRLPHCPDCHRPLTPDLSCPECPYWWSWANWDGHLPEWVR